MKKFYSIIAMLSAAFLLSFTSPDNIEKVIDALKEGNATEIAQQFDNNVELTFPDKSNSYSKAQAELVLKDFFSNNKVKGFALKHKGNSAVGQFCIGTLSTSGGEYRTNVFMKVNNGKTVIKEIRFQSVE